MLFNPDNLPYLRNVLLVLTLFMIGCAGYAYHVNARRAGDDPLKRNFYFGAVWLAPVTWPLFMLAGITIFILRVFVYTVSLVLFTVAFLAIRKPFLFIWLDKIATKVGNKLLAANTLLIKIFFGKKVDSPPSS
jgi:hypothetical protein